MKTFVRTLLLLVFIGGLFGCAKVGSERWCSSMTDKPKVDWTASEAADYAKHCVFR